LAWRLRLAGSHNFARTPALAPGIVVKDYEDTPLGVGETGSRGEGRFVRVTLRPKIVVVRGFDLAKADQLHHDVHQFCFIARSINFPVSYEASYSEI
jgi:organic hydroperoxide reductase OsmC/OhrA